MYNDVLKLDEIIIIKLFSSHVIHQQIMLTSAVKQVNGTGESTRSNEENTTLFQHGMSFHIQNY